jgi:hypothetical protein
MSNEPAKEIKNSILILKSNPMALLNAEAFLISRGWEVFTTTDLHETIKIVLTKEPEYILLCANHPQKKIKNLPRILAQAVPIKVILYVDMASTINISLMNEMGFPNHILPPVSGPAIERAVFKFEKDENSKQIDKRRHAKSAMNNFSFDKGGGKTDFELKLDQFLNSESDDTEINLTSMPSEAPTDGYPLENPEPEKKPETFAEYEERKRKERVARMQQESTYAIDLKEKPTQIVEPLNYTPEKNSDLKNPNNAVIKGAQHALGSSVKHNSSKKEIEKLEQSQNCVCIVIDSTRFGGYLIAALGKNRRFDDEFVKNIQTKLYDFLKAQGEKLDEESPLEITIKTVEFEDWALEQAEFLKKSVHNGDEVAMAFFPTEKTTPDVEQSAREDMLQININDLEGDIQLLFDLYIFLPANNRYVLYTPKGGTFLANQKDRLKGKGITHMHLKKDAINSAKTYAAQNYLNNKVEAFNENKEEKDKKKSS